MGIWDRIINRFWRLFILPKAKIVLDNTTYKIPRLQLNNFYTSTYHSEKWLLNLLKSISRTRKINTFIDVGANIGQTLLKIKSINPDVQYVGFEPNPNCVSFTSQIISANNLKNSIMVNCGLSDRGQLLKLNLDREGDPFDSSASLIEGFRKEKQEFQFVPVLELDEVLSNLQLKQLVLIKIDIEGGELEAIRGMLNTIKNYNPIIVIEVLPAYEISNIFRVNRQRELALLLSNANYRIFHIRFKLKEVYIEEVIEFPIHKNIKESDYLLLHKNINIKELGLNTIN